MEVVSDSRNQIIQVVHVIIVYRKNVLWKRKRFVINFSFLYENVEKKWRVRKITHSVKQIQTDILNSHIFHICKNLLIPAMFLAVSRTVLCRHMMSSLYVPWLFTKVIKTSATYLTSHFIETRNTVYCGKIFKSAFWG